MCTEECRDRDAAVRGRRSGGAAEGASGGETEANPRPTTLVPWTATVATDNGREGHASRGAIVAGKEQNTVRQKAHSGSRIFSRKRVNNGSPVFSHWQAHGDIFSINYVALKKTIKWPACCLVFSVLFVC